MSARCNTPRKLRYRTAETARNAVARINERRGLTGTDREQEPYECCGHFHARTIAKQWRWPVAS